MEFSEEGQASSAARFDTTRWSIVVAAGRDETSHSREALESLCQNYWRPIYAYLRRHGYGVHDAQDLTQGFFARFLEKNYLKAVSPEKGRFRYYLLGALKHYLSNERDRAQAKKRGGGRAFVPLDDSGAESHYRIEPRDELTPEKIFDRSWALTLLDQVLSRVEGEFVSADKQVLFDRLKVCLTGGESTVPYKQTAAELNISEGAVKVTVHRMRRRYREILNEEVAQTVGSPEDTQDEIRYLLAAFSL